MELLECKYNLRRDCERRFLGFRAKAFVISARLKTLRKFNTLENKALIFHEELYKL